MRPESQEPPFHRKVETAISALGWVTGCALAVGTAAWFRTLRRVIRAG